MLPKKAYFGVAKLCSPSTQRKTSLGEEMQEGVVQEVGTVCAEIQRPRALLCSASWGSPLGG